MKLIIIAGMPATGKSRLSQSIQKAFGYPVIEKDGIKEQLFDTIGFKCYAEKRQLDVASNAVLFEIMECLYRGSSSAIIVNNFASEDAERLDAFLKRDGIECVTVFLSGDPQVLYERYYERDKNGLRHAGHAMQEKYPPDEKNPEIFDMSREGFDRRFLKLGMDKPGWSGRIIRLDGTYPWEIDTDALIRETAEYLGVEGVIDK